MHLKDRFGEQLHQLVEMGINLSNAMQREIVGDAKYQAEARRQLGDAQYDKFVEKLPHFKTEYENWYSQCVSVIKQILPDRLDHFVSFYEKPKNRKSIEYGNYTIQDFMIGLVVTGPMGDRKVGPDAAYPQFEQQLAIIKAAEKRLGISLYDIRSILQADVFDSELEGAEALYKNGFLRAAGVICGVLIEKHLSELLQKRNSSLRKKNPSINDLNESLKQHNAIDIPQWRHITLMADYRNICCHAKQGDPNRDQVRELIDGTKKILHTLF